MGDFSGPTGSVDLTPKLVNGVKARPFLAPAREFGIKYVMENASAKIAALMNKGKTIWEAAEIFLVGAADAVRVVAHGKAPKDTGTLANSIHVTKIESLWYKVGTNVFYAPFMEFGTGIYGPYGQAYPARKNPKPNLPPGLKRSGGKRSGGNKKGV